MQLNNLVIISIPHPSHNPLSTLDTHSLSPSKVSTTSASLKDDILWKKSISAFKKFKGKKDRETKTPKHFLNNLPFLQQQPAHPTLNTNFCLVDNDIKFSLLTNQDYELIKFEDNFDYFDPNSAPFFEFGVTYNFPQLKHNREKSQEPQQNIKINKKASSTPRLKKDPSKKDKLKQQNTDHELLLKTQKSHSSQNIAPADPCPGFDPFIIVKAAQMRPNQISQCQSRDQPKRYQQIKKTKSIRKKTKYVSLSEAIYSREAYSRPRSEEINEPEEDLNEERSMGYGNDELPMIEFDFGMTIAPRDTESQNGFDNLPIYETRDLAQVRARMRPFINSTEILHEYQFNPAFIHKEHMIQPKQQMEIQSEQAFEKA